MKSRPKPKSSNGFQPDSGACSTATGVGVAVAGRGGTVGVAVPAAAAASAVAVAAAPGTTGVEVAEKAGRVLVGVGSGVAVGETVGVVVGVRLGVDVGAGGAGVGSMIGVTGTPVGVGIVVAVGRGVTVGSGVTVGGGVSVGGGGSGVLVGLGVLVAVGGRVAVHVGEGIRVEVGLGVGSPWASDGEACQRIRQRASTPTSGGANRKARFGCQGRANLVIRLPPSSRSVMRRTRQSHRITLGGATGGFAALGGREPCLARLAVGLCLQRPL